MSKNEANAFWRYLNTLKAWVDRILSGICIFIVGGMTVLVTYQVVARYLFNSPSAISEVLSRYMFIWLILFGSAYVFGLREHMAISFIKEKFPAKVQLLVDMFTELVTVTFAISIMIIGGYSSTMRQMWQLDSALQIPMGMIYAAIPISGGLIVFYFIYNEINLIRRFNQFTNKRAN